MKKKSFRYFLFNCAESIQHYCSNITYRQLHFILLLKVLELHQRTLTYINIL